jgi:hypothetical protein
MPRKLAYAQLNATQQATQCYTHYTLSTLPVCKSISASRVISKLTNATAGIAIRDSINVLTAQRYAQPPSHKLKGFVRALVRVCRIRNKHSARSTSSKCAR